MTISVSVSQGEEKEKTIISSGVAEEVHVVCPGFGIEESSVAGWATVVVDIVN